MEQVYTEYLYLMDMADDCESKAIRCYLKGDSFMSAFWHAACEGFKKRIDELKIPR